MRIVFAGTPCRRRMGGLAMSLLEPLERLFRLEIDFHHRLHTLAPDTPDRGSVHTSFAIQCGYEPLIRSLGTVTARDVHTVQQRLLQDNVNVRDILAARDSVNQLLGIRQREH